MEVNLEKWKEKRNLVRFATTEPNCTVEIVLDKDADGDYILNHEYSMIFSVSKKDIGLALQAIALKMLAKDDNAS